MLDMTLALIFSQLPHPECWLPRSHWRLSIAFGLLCLLGSLGACLVLVFVWWWSLSPEAPILYVWLASHSRGSSAVWHCGHFTVWYCTRLPQCLLCSNVLLPSWLKPYSYSAHRFIVSRLGRVGFFFRLLFPSHFLLWHSVPNAMLSCLFHSVSLLQTYSHCFQSLC